MKHAKEAFPKVRASDWLYQKWDPNYCIPDPVRNNDIAAFLPSVVLPALPFSFKTAPS